MDFGLQEIEIICPKCKFYNYVFIKQIISRDVIICRGCKINLQLDDYMDEVKNFTKQFDYFMKNLNNLFKG